MREKSEETITIITIDPGDIYYENYINVYKDVTTTGSFFNKKTKANVEYKKKEKPELNVYKYTVNRKIKEAKQTVTQDEESLQDNTSKFLEDATKNIIAQPLYSKEDFRKNMHEWTDVKYFDKLGITREGNYSFQFEEPKTVLYSKEGKTDKVITHPSYYTKTGKRVEEKTQDVTQNINIKVNLTDTLYSIQEYAFSGCTQLKSINLEHVKSIGDFAFEGCTGLESITIPRTVEKMGEGVFNRCENLKTIIFEGVEPPEFVTSYLPYSIIGNYAAGIKRQNTNTIENIDNEIEYLSNIRILVPSLAVEKYEKFFDGMIKLRKVDSFYYDDADQINNKIDELIKTVLKKIKANDEQKESGGRKRKHRRKRKTKKRRKIRKTKKTKRRKRRRTRRKR